MSDGKGSVFVVDITVRSPRRERQAQEPHAAPGKDVGTDAGASKASNKKTGRNKKPSGRTR